MRTCNARATACGGKRIGLEEVPKACCMALRAAVCGSGYERSHASIGARGHQAGNGCRQQGCSNGEQTHGSLITCRTSHPFATTHPRCGYY